MHLTFMDWITLGAFTVVALGIASRDSLAEGSPMAKHLPRFLRSRIWSYVPLIALMVGIGTYLYGHWNEKEIAIGFSPPWPDAIVCKMKEPSDLTATGPVSTTFFFRGIGTRGKYGDVAMYYFPGWRNTWLPKGFNQPETGYLTVEIWFQRSTGKLEKPFGDAKGENFFESLYRTAYVGDPDCGGDNISAVKANGNAFVFARPFK